MTLQRKIAIFGMMRYLIAIFLLAISCFAQEYGVMSVCTKVDGKEYCYLSPGEYRSVEMDGTMVVAVGFNIQRYTAVTKETVLTNGNGTTVRFWEADDDTGNRFIMHRSRDNLFITDTTGCAMMKYMAGSPDTFRRIYRFQETDSIDLQMKYIVKCRESRAQRKTK